MHEFDVARVSGVKVFLFFMSFGIYWSMTCLNHWHSSDRLSVAGVLYLPSLLTVLEGHKVEITVKRPSIKELFIIRKDDLVFVAMTTLYFLFMIMGAFVGLDKHIVKRIEDMMNCFLC
ncbi:BTE_collapsed_G0004130.mRNA.1.CDS.1 [Saccharomyces cerevisiae]|nr:BTE_collapsed_G0004130.mRNA.1.CDS.1 [Saccharomyces cerevisiae]